MRDVGGPGWPRPVDKSEGLGAGLARALSIKVGAWGAWPARAGLIWATYHLGQVKGPLTVSSPGLRTSVDQSGFQEQKTWDQVNIIFCPLYRGSPHLFVQARANHFRPVVRHCCIRILEAPVMRVTVRLQVILLPS